MATNASEPQARPGESVVVYVHGIGRHEPADELKLQWDLALFGRDLGARSRMAYWSDLVHPPRGPGTKSAAEPGLAALLEGGTVERRAYARALLRGLGVDPAAVRRGGPGKKIVPLPGAVRRPLSYLFLSTFVADTAAYFFRPALRERIRARLRAQLAGVQGRSVTVVAHSQGSIVAYEVLSELQREGLGFQLEALVTIGSPLGIQEVQDFLVPRPPQVPPPVDRWMNFADLLDPVAFDKGLAADFPASDLHPRPVTVEDRTIVSPGSRRLVGFNPHSAVGYLAHPDVRLAVGRAMRLDAVGRFVIARDVAELLSLDDSVRQPVLIEALEPGYRALDEEADETGRREAAERAALPAGATLRLEHRIAALEARLKEIVADVEAAKIDPLRRFVAAELTASELRRIGREHRDLRVYAVWRSSRKSKHTHRSMRPIKADAALASFSASGVGITWAVLDTGIQGDHPHFAGLVREVWDCTRRGRPVRVPLNEASDADGHGTHVAGIITGQGSDGERALRGVAPQTQLVVYKVLADDGEGQDAWIIKALDHIAAQNEQITDGLAIHGVNLSLGGPFDNTVYGCGFSPLCAELRRLWRAGVLVVVSAGNEGTLQVSTPDGETEMNAVMSIGDPANLEECVAVGSVHADKPHLYGISSFSSRGPTADGRAKPDVVAPGERIRSCNAAFRRADPASWYREDSGSSMAAPHVSGLLAAFLSVRREFRARPDEVKRVLLSTCTDLGRDRYHQGRGMPNLMQMLLSV